MTKEELIKELEELRDIENYSQSELMNTGYKTGLLDAMDLVNKYFALTPVSGSVSVESHYSGNASKQFWEIVNSLKNDADRQELYSLGVALQNHEEYVLRTLWQIKKRYVRGRKHCR